MVFLLQSDADISLMERRAIQLAAAMQPASAEQFILMPRSLAEIAQKGVPDNCVPVGSVEFCQAVAAQQGIRLPGSNSYPTALHAHMHRSLRHGKLLDAKPEEFVKPRHQTKAFTGCLKRDVSPDVPNDMEVWISEPVRFVSEYRAYVCSKEIVGVARYDDGADDAPQINHDVLVAMVDSMRGMNLAGYSLDLGVLTSGETVLVEVNDGWALGFYRGCHPLGFARLLHSRWKQLGGSSAACQN